MKHKIPANQKDASLLKILRLPMNLCYYSYTIETSKICMQIELH